MFEIISKKKLGENLFEIKIKAEFSKNAKAGQFVIIKIDEQGERIPLTIADNDEETITMVFLMVGYSTEQLSKLDKGDFVMDFVGPLGNASEIENYGTVVLVGGGCGIAPIYPQARDLKKAGNNVIVVAGFRNKEMIFWEEKLKKVSDELIIMTDDGSYGKKGYAAEGLKEVIKREKVDRVVIIGPPIMMKYTSQISKGIPTVVSINSIMVDGIGMCGACRVTVDNQIKFACVDGPEFYADKVDFDELINRNSSYMDEESVVGKKHNRCY